MSANIRFRAKVLERDKHLAPDNGWVEGFYFEDLDNGEVCGFIFNCPCVWRVDRRSVRVSRGGYLEPHSNPTTKIDDIKELQERLMQTTIDFINERNLDDIWAVNFHADGLWKSAIEHKKWVPAMDSSIEVEGLEWNKEKEFYERKEIGSYM